MRLNRYIEEGSNFLKENNIKSYMIDAELLMSSVSNLSRENLLFSNVILSIKAQINFLYLFNFSIPKVYYSFFLIS